MSQPEWFYASKGSQHGPIGEEALTGLIARGEIGPADLVWRAGMRDWIPASTLAGSKPENASAVDMTADSWNTAVSLPAPPVGASTAVLPYQGGGIAIDVSARTIQLLRQTRPWVLLISILGFVVTGFIAMGAVGMLVNLNFRSSRRGIGGEMVTLTLVYGLIGLAYFMLSFYLCKYAVRIGKLSARGNVEALESALDAQRSFWRLLGIVALAAIVGYGVLMAILFGRFL